MGVTLGLVEFPQILFENEDYIALNKPAGWFSIPAREPSAKDLVLTEWIKNDHKTEAWTIHRLDRFTSGIILFAKNKSSQAEGSTWFQKRKIKKTYQFLSSPSPRMPAVQIREPVDGKSSQTLFEVIEKNEIACFGKATPLTGRFHQVRDHAAFGGFPILGDQKFGGLATLLIQDEIYKIPRVCLHAFELQLPFGTFQAPLALDLLTLKQKLFP